MNTTTETLFAKTNATTHKGAFQAIYQDADLAVWYATLSDEAGRRVRALHHTIAIANRPAGRYGLDASDTLPIVPALEEALRAELEALAPVIEKIKEGRSRGLTFHEACIHADDHGIDSEDAATLFGLD